MGKVTGVTHEEFVRLKDGSHAFITGVPDKCEHDDNLVVYELSNGDQLYEKDHMCTTSEDTYNHIEYLAEQRGATIVGSTSACSKCRKIFTLRDLMGDAFWM